MNYPEIGHRDPTDSETHEPMKSQFLLTGLLCLGSGAALAQTTQNYPDATGDVAVGSFPHLDISSVDVTVDAAGENISFKINLQGSPIATDWGKYMIGVRSGPGGTTSGNGWGRPISMAGGMTHWIGCWMDGGTGANLRSYTGGAWSAPSTPSVTRDATSITLTTTVGALALSPGEQFSFDVYSSGGGGNDTAVEALSAAAASATAWNNAYTTNAVGGTPNPALTFTMPGTPDFATWIATYGLFDNDALPGTDYDNDGLTNKQEFDLDIGLDPSLADTDNDGLKDGWENLTGSYVDGTHTGSNPMVADSDNDGMSDGDEVLLAPGDPLDYLRDPNHFNYTKITVPGTFNTPGTWNANGDAVPSNTMTVAGQGVTDQFQWTLDYRFATPKSSFEQKFAIGSWDTSWGPGATAGTAAPGGGNFTRTVEASGMHRFSFNTATLAQSFTRVSFPDVTAYLAAYGLAAGADQDGDGLNNEVEFTKNSDPYNVDTDGDGLNDNVDPDPVVVAPESRQILFQVNMSVMVTQGNFTPGTSVVRVVGLFEGWNTNAGVVLTDPDADGIYTGTYAAGGFAGTSFGGYKFFVNGGPNGGYENGDNRSFNLGPADVQQVLPVVYFSNVEPPAGFDAWIASFTGLSDTSRGGDPDHDGSTNEQEFLFGGSPATGNGSLVTTSQGPSGLVVHWLQRTAGVTYTLQENADLADEWTTGPVTPAAAADQTGVPADYVRMEAVIPMTGGRNLVRVSGAEN